MGLVLKHVQELDNGTWRYRRRVKDSLRELVGKREITKVLGQSKKDALAAYPEFHAEAEKLLAFAERALRAPAPKAAAAKSALQLHQDALERIRGLGVDPFRNALDPDEDDQWVGRSVVADAIFEGYPVDEEGNPIGVTPEDAALVRVVQGGAGKRPTPTLEDAKTFYLENRVKRGKFRNDPIGQRRDEQSATLVVSHAITALGENRKIISLKRQDANVVADYMLASLGIKASSVQRYINIIKAVVSKAITEFDLNMKNPFDKLEVEEESLPQDRKRPFSAEELAAIRARVVAKANDDLKLIWRLLEGTGCRIAEVTKLRREDVKLVGNHPHIAVVAHEDRRLKTKASVRRVPLVGDALEAAREAFTRAGTGKMLFDRYSTPRGQTSASNLLNQRHIRAVTTDKRATVHSLRDNMKDRLRKAKIDNVVQRMILGHTLGGNPENYGGEEVRLEMAYEAMVEAFGRRKTLLTPNTLNPLSISAAEGEQDIGAERGAA